MKSFSITSSCVLLASFTNAFTIPTASVQRSVLSHTTSSSLNMAIDPSDLINNIASSFSSTMLADVADVADIASAADAVDITSAPDVTDVAAAAADAADAVTQPSYSKVSYYTTLGLYVMSFPGLWSQIKRSTTAKLKRKTYLR